MAGRLLQFYGVNDNVELLKYVNEVGNYVARHSDFPDRRYMFHVLKSESVNAFACPGGYILVTLGTIKNAKNEAELAMILGHEIAHVGKQHMFSTLKKMNAKEAEETAKNIDDPNAHKDEISEARKRPNPESNKAIEYLAKYISSATGGSGLNFLQAAKAGMALILEKGLDKSLEFEADYEGVIYAIRSGYDPKALLTFLDRLSETKKLKKLNMSILDKTHPKISERIQKIKRELSDLDLMNAKGAVGKDRFKVATEKQKS
jgi:predicted Zn-dependent protease